jgi:hypothetical protein
MTNRATAQLGRVAIGVIALFGGWLLGGYLGSVLLPYSEHINKMETLPTKIGASVGVFAASLFTSRYLLRSVVLALACLTATELTVLCIVVLVTGLSSFSLSDLRFNFCWLFQLTWNVVTAVIFGAAIGLVWERRVPNKINLSERGQATRVANADALGRPRRSVLALGSMKPEVIASHRALFSVLVGLFEVLQLASLMVVWSVDPRRHAPLSDAAGITVLFSLMGLFVLWWLLRVGAPRLASICLVSALIGILCSMFLPAVP